MPIARIAQVIALTVHACQLRPHLASATAERAWQQCQTRYPLVGVGVITSYGHPCYLVVGRN